MVKCGEGLLLYTYPAWTFPGKRNDLQAPPGPGAGKYAVGSMNNGIGPRMGRAPYAPEADAGPLPPNPGTAHIKPGYLSAERRQPAYSFGNRLPGRPDETPGPLDYRPQTVQAAKAASWGPPPRTVRPMSAPRAAPLEEPRPYKAKGPTIKGPFKPLHDERVPGPGTYKPCGGFCKCLNCQYAGVTMGRKLPQMYGKKEVHKPSPAEYHVDCTTIGFATFKCEDGEDLRERAVARSRAAATSRSR